MTVVSAQGREYSDAGETARDMRNGGSKTWLLPMLADVMLEILRALNAADAAEESAVIAESLAASLSGTSATSLAVGSGTVILQTQAGKFFSRGTFLLVQHAADPSVFMYCRSIAYNSATGALAATVLRYEGGSTFGDWQINVTGMAGLQGAVAPPELKHRSVGASGSVTAADVFRFLHLTAGSALAVDSVASLGNAFSVFLKNEGSTAATITPASGNLIDGRSSRKVWPGEAVLMTCDATKLMCIVLDPGSSGVLHLQNRSGPQGLLLNAQTTVVLDTVVANTLEGASLAGNVTTLPAGQYEGCGSGLFTGGGGGAKLSLYNNTSGAILLSSNGGVAGSLLEFDGPFTLTAPANLIARVYSTAPSGAGLGTIVSDGNPNIAFNLFIKKVA